MPPKSSHARKKATATPVAQSATSLNPKHTDGRASRSQSHVLSVLTQSIHAKPLVERPPVAQETPSPFHGDLLLRLCAAVHGMLLITKTEKAQQGSLAIPRDSTTAVGTSTASNSDAPVLPLCVVVNARWLDAVTRYCNFTITIDDVARVAAAFPEWVRVKWYAPDDPTTPMSGSMMGGARLYALVPHTVPSVADAEAKLTEQLQALGGASKQRQWKDRISDMNASQAYVEQERNHRRASPAVIREQELQQPAQTGKKDVAALPLPDQVRDREHLLAQISPALRESLSDAKLQAVVDAIRRDEAKEGDREFARVQRQLEEERLVASYAHVRSVFGPKRESMSAAALVHSLETESRLRETRGALRQLSLLLQRSGSGLTAVTIDLGEGETEEAPPKKKTKKKVTKKRGRNDTETEAAEGTGAMAARTLRANEIEALSREQLDSVLISLDRSKGSLQALLQSNATTAA